MIPAPWFNFAVALGLGLLIGLEREHSKGDGSARRPAGIRTFGLTALLGAIAIHLGGILLLAVAMIGVLGLTMVSYLRDHDDDRGLTTEIGLIATPMLGALAMSDALLASGLGATVAIAFAAKPWLHGFIRQVLTGAEVNDCLVFAAATLAIWPQLPDRPMGPWNALNPHDIWLLVVMVLALSACGHIATRILGPRYGLPVAGLASGFVSSTATIGSMAGRAIKDPANMSAAVAGSAFSTVATFIQMAVLLMTISISTLVLMAPALAAGAVTAALYGLAFARQSGAADIDSKSGRAFSIQTALGLGATMAAMLLIAAALRAWLGEAGVIAGAVVAGFVDTHAAAISVASLAASAQVMPQEAIVPILAAMTSNAVAKMVMAAAMGSTAFVVRIAPALVLSMAAAWAGAMPMILR